MKIHWFIKQLKQHTQKVAMVVDSNNITYKQLLEATNTWAKELLKNKVTSGQRVVIVGGYSLNGVALLLALIANKNIVVPIADLSTIDLGEYIETVQANHLYCIEGDDLLIHKKVKRSKSKKHKLFKKLNNLGDPGLILFSSGSTGKSKAVLLNFNRLLNKFRTPRTAFCTMIFLLPDHIGGINSLLYVLSCGGTAVIAKERTVHGICKLIEDNKVELLPTTPTFLNMLLISGQNEKFDLSSLKMITYGTEPMQQSTLLSLKKTLPDTLLKQTYGMSEIGILRTKSKDSGSLWVKVGGEDYKTKIIDGILWIKSQTSMLGYLNAPSPFDKEGWLNTGDAVEREGEYIKILGRKTEIINVGGEKVYPAEVESVLLELENISDVKVSGKASPVTGQVVLATVVLTNQEDAILLKRRIRKLCAGKLSQYKIPAIITISEGPLYGSRFKKSQQNNNKKVVVISGGSKGLGSVLVSRFLGAGYCVATYSRSKTKFIDGLLAKKNYAESFLYTSVDGTSASSLKDFIQGVTGQFGKIDILINNAGIAPEGLLPMSNEEDIAATLDLNLKSVLNLTRLCSRVMLAKRSGCIINISSVNAIRGHSGVVAYSATKAALDGMTRALAKELGPKQIRVNSVAPGYFESEMVGHMDDKAMARIARRTPLGRLGTTDDIANAVLFLTSEKANFITGQTLIVDGGITC